MTSQQRFIPAWSLNYCKASSADMTRHFRASYCLRIFACGNLRSKLKLVSFEQSTYCKARQGTPCHACHPLHRCLTRGKFEMRDALPLSNFQDSPSSKTSLQLSAQLKMSQEHHASEEFSFILSECWTLIQQTGIKSIPLGHGCDSFMLSCLRGPWCREHSNQSRSPSPVANELAHVPDAEDKKVARVTTRPV